MDGFSQYCESIGNDDLSFSHNSDPFPNSRVPADHVTESSSYFSDAATTNSSINCGNEEENITLASSNPKKRTGRKKYKETRHPVYRGVRMRNSNKWVCEVREPNKRNRIWLGTYSTAEMAARAHDVAVLALRGENSCLNFADSEWRLPKPASNDPEDIQRAAAEAAAMFNTESEDADNQNEDNEMISTADLQKDASDDNVNNTEPCEQSQQLSFNNMENEGIFDMPGLLNDMAEGLLLSPPPSYIDGQSTWDDTEKDTDMTLWNWNNSM